MRPETRKAADSLMAGRLSPDTGDGLVAQLRHDHHYSDAEYIRAIVGVVRARLASGKMK